MSKLRDHPVTTKGSKYMGDIKVHVSTSSEKLPQSEYSPFPGEAGWASTPINSDETEAPYSRETFLPVVILLTQLPSSGNPFKRHGRDFVFVSYETTILYT